VDLPELVDLVWNDGCGITLPIDLLVFKGTQRGNIVRLDWKMADQTQPVTFEVQRSFDGRTFNSVGQLAYFTGKTEYHWEDPIEKAGVGRVYYRLKLKYVQKPEEFSDIYSIHLQGAAKFTVFPDPGSNRVWVDFGTGSFTGKLMLININGMRMGEMDAKQVSGRVPMVFNKLMPGQYTMVLMEAGKSGKPVTQSFTILR
jgi:hypothetical protein